MNKKERQRLKRHVRANVRRSLKEQVGRVVEEQLDRRLKRMIIDVYRSGSSGLDFGAFALPQFSKLYRKQYVMFKRNADGGYTVYCLHNP